jgi:phage minor structural protein
MIQIYKSSNTNYAMNGDATLFPESCSLEAELNGEWTLTLENPLDKNFRLLQEEAVISCDTFLGKNQKFRIFKKGKSDDGVTAYAYPLFFDLGHTLLLDVRPTAKTGQQALDIMLAGTGFTAQSNLTTVATTYYQRVNILNAISGDDENSFLNRWGGEILYSNKNIIINQSAGSDKGVRAEFGHNLNAITEEVDLTNVITRIIPVAYNGYMLDGSAPWVDSPNIGKYSIIYEKEVKFDDVKLTEDAQEDETSYATLAELQVELISRCNAMFAAGCDSPNVQYTVDMVELSQTVEYQNYKQLEGVSLGDIVYCKNKNLDIDVKAKVIKIKYDSIEKRNDEITLGNYTYDYFTQITGTINQVSDITDDSGDLLAERVSGIIDGMRAQLRTQRTIAEKSNVRAVLFEDLDPSSPTYGAMALGTQGFEIASARTVDDSDWDWRTFGTSKGFYADLIIAGILYSQNYVSGSQGLKIDLNSGTLAAKYFSVDADGKLGATNANITGTITSASATITGGSMNVTTSGKDSSAISLQYGDYRNEMTPGRTAVTQGNNKIFSGMVTDLTSGAVSGLIAAMVKDGTYTYDTKASLDTNGNFSCKGTKSRIAETENYGNRLMYCYEAPSPVFGDMGTGEIQEDGYCYIYMDDVFAETVDIDCDYFVFMQPYGDGKIIIKEKTALYFLVSGDPGTQFAWEVKTKQLGYDGIRLEKPSAISTEISTDYEEEAAQYLSEYEKEMLNYEESN